jgi:HAD superfamily hydrolase (TIGR01549 family)
MGKRMLKNLKIIILKMEEFLGIDEAMNFYSDIVKIDLEKSDITPNLSQLKKKYKKQNWLIVSGSNQNELQQVFKKRKIDKYFDSGIYGSPKDKITILNELRSASKLKKKTIYFGDSLYDYECSKKCNIDFCFVSKWSELKDWKDIFRNKDIKTISSLEDLI